MTVVLQYVCMHEVTVKQLLDCLWWNLVLILFPEDWKLSADIDSCLDQLFWLWFFIFMVQVSCCGHDFCFYWNNTTIEWTVVKSGSGIHCTQRIQFHKFCNSLTPTARSKFWLVTQNHWNKFMVSRGSILMILLLRMFHHSEAGILCLAWQLNLVLTVRLNVV